MAITLSAQHRVRDYDTWRSAFDAHAPIRRQHGCTAETVYRGADDPDSIVVVMEYPSREAALGFLADPSLKQAMETSGVITEPKAVIGESLAPQPV